MTPEEEALLRRLNDPSLGEAAALGARGPFAPAAVYGLAGKGAQYVLDKMGYQTDPVTMQNQTTMPNLAADARERLVRALLGQTFMGGGVSKAY
jgi:hypothetical protein